MAQLSMPAVHTPTELYSDVEDNEGNSEGGGALPNAAIQRDIDMTPVSGGRRQQDNGG